MAEQDTEVDLNPLEDPDPLEIWIIRAWIRIRSWNHQKSQKVLKSDSGSRAGIVTALIENQEKTMRCSGIFCLFFSEWNHIRGDHICMPRIPESLRSNIYETKRHKMSLQPLRLFLNKAWEAKRWTLQGVPCIRRPELCWLRFGEFPRLVGHYCSYRGYRILWLSACDTFVCMFHQFPTLCFELEQIWDHIYNIIVY